MSDRLSKLSILVVDDEPVLAPLYEKSLADAHGHLVEVVCSPGEALHLCSRTLYDIIVCDAKMPYKGSPLGGVVLGEELSCRFGSDSVLLISQVVDSVAVRAINTQLPFLKKGRASKLDQWLGTTLPSKIRALVRRQFGFVAMPFGNRELDTLYKKTILPAVARAGFRVNRVDEEPFTRAIIAKIFRLIREAHFVIFLASECNPNVYYEAGYAAALGKQLIMCAPRISDLPFDIRGDNCLTYYRKKRTFGKRVEELLKQIRCPRGT